MARPPLQPHCVALTWLRERVGWTQRQLAEAAGISKAHVSGYERGTRNLGRRRLRQLASAIGYTLAEVDLVQLVVVALGRDSEACAPTHPAAVHTAEARCLRQAAAHVAVEAATLAQRCLGARLAADPAATPHLPQLLGIALSWLRERLAWTQQELAATAGVPNFQISGYERGSRTLKRTRFEELVAAMSYTPAEVDLVLCTIAAVSPQLPGGSLSGTPGVATESPQARIAREAAAHLAVEVAALAQSCIRVGVATRRIARDRAEADRLWRRLRRATPQARRLLVRHKLGYQSWALAERLAEESCRAASKSATAAVELAQLAVTAARLGGGRDVWRSRLEGYTRAFLANALRVEGHLAQASDEWKTAWRVWREGATGDPTAILPEWRLLDLEASLRRDTRSFAAARDLLDRAIAAAPPTAAGRIRLNLALTLEQAGEVTAALATLQEAAPLVRAGGEPRLLWALGFNLCVNLCHLGQFAQADEQLAALRQLTLDLGNELDVLRVVWLSGRVAAGLGDREEARAAFAMLRQEYAKRKDGFGTALVSMELAIFHLEDGQLPEVRRLSIEMSWIFAAEGVEREALASLQLFCEAARREAATVDQARCVLRLLDRSPQRGAHAP
jgi:transcriptional regulator with XRE-family HTH domain/tetratricopeptide (TPR) repeat protein